MAGMEYSTSNSHNKDQRSNPKKRRLKLKSVDTIEKSGLLHQQCAWISLHKCINDLIHNVNAKNIKDIRRHIINLNIVRGRGLFCQSIMQKQVISMEKTDIYATLISLINPDFPNVGELLISRCIVQFKKAYTQGVKIHCTAIVRFIAHLINRSVVFSYLGIELIKLFLKSKSEESIELAFEIINICAHKLYEEKKNEMDALLKLTCYIFYNEQLNTKAHYRIITILTAVSYMKDKPKTELDDLLPKNKVQFTHELTLRFTNDAYDFLDDFELDPDYIANEKIYKQYVLELLEPEIKLFNSRISDADDERDNEEETETVKIMISLSELSIKRSINAIVDCTFTYKAVADELKNIKLNPGEEINMWCIFINRCCDQRIYKEHFGRIAQIFCELKPSLVKPLETIFVESYVNIHSFNIEKLQNIARFFAFLLYTDSISWNVLSVIHLNENETTHISRRFIQVLFEELNKYMEYDGLMTRVQESYTKKAFEGIFPDNNQRDLQFSKDFFTSLGLDGLIDEFRNTLII